MAQRGVQLDRKKVCCSICLELPKDPVAIPCGHSYCRTCIKGLWEDEEIRSCPQCKQIFTQRPVLVKNTMLADVVEELKRTGLADPTDHCAAGPEDVACDVCDDERKLKAVKSCLVCLASYCEKHLQPHYDVAPLKKHKLVEPSNKLQENICSRHDEVMKMFCRTDQQCICYLCPVDEHKGHDTVSAAAERTERQKELELSRQKIQQRIEVREQDLMRCQQQVEAIDGSSDKALEHSEKIFTELIDLLEKRRSDVEQQIRSKQDDEKSLITMRQEMLKQEITDLKSRDAELKEISQTEDHNQFLHSYLSLSQLNTSIDFYIVCPLPLVNFHYVTVAVTKTRDKILEALSDTEVDVILAQAEHKSALKKTVGWKKAPKREK